MVSISEVMVNWSDVSEYMLEPYEWQSDDDIEILNYLNVIKVSSEIISYLFYDDYCFDDLYKYNDSEVLGFSDGNFIVVVEFDAKKRIISRSVLDYVDRKRVTAAIEHEKAKVIELSGIVTLEKKEFGLTRLEREKKMYLLSKLDVMYVCKDDKLKTIYQLCFLKMSDDYEKMYQDILDLIEGGYHQVHETMYRILCRG